MPKTKKVKKTKTSGNNSLFKVKWGESYTSLFLGIVVVVVAAVLVFSFLKDRNFNKTTSTQSTSTTEASKMNGNLPKTYIVKAGDDLWNISLKIYGSGYNWVDLAKANNLENPGVLYSGTKLTVPNVKPIVVQEINQSTSLDNVVQNKNSITGTSYVIQKGDYLWEISVRAYGDGFKWVQIAKANNLTNPDLIHSGNTLILPR